MKLISSKLSLRVCLAVALWVTVDGQTVPPPGQQYCSSSSLPTSPTTAQTPPLPQIPNTFSTRLEATIVDKNFTVSATEYFDYSNNRAALHMLKAGLLYRLIFDYKNDQLFYVMPDDTCQTTNLTVDDNNLLFGNVQLSHGLHVFSTNGALHFAAKSGQVYMGTKVIRGVQCDHWRSCLYWAQLQSNFTLDYYFTTQNWMPAAGIAQIPVRAEIFGVQSKPSKAMTPFHHVYDYVDFNIQLDPTTTVFETPSLVVCPGRKQTRAVPSLQNAYVYREEIVTQSTNAITQADVWYDQTYKLVRYDSRPNIISFPFFNTDPSTRIHDYNTGVAYAIDRAMGNCTILPIQNASFDASIQINKSLSNPDFVLTMKSPNQLFYLDSNYTFEGQRHARGAICDVFISKRSDYMLGGITFDAVFEFYFLALSEKEVNNEGAVDPTSTDIPIQLIVTVPSIPYTVTYSIYNFDQEDPEITNFDVSSCYTSDQRIKFRITYYGTFDATVMAYKEIFLFNTISTVARTAGVSPLRISKPNMIMQPDTAYFTATLLDKAPVLQRYRKILGKTVKNNNDKVMQAIMDVNDCANLCIQEPTFTCNSFEYCPQSSVCTLSKIHTNDGTVVDNTQSCDLYDRTLGTQSYQEVDLNRAWTNLKNSIIKRLFKISIAFDKNTQTYTAVDVADVSAGENNPQSTMSLLSKFKSMVGKYVPKFDDLVLTGMSIDDCAQACINEEVFVCNSFEYEYTNNFCYLSHFHPDEQPDKIQSSSGIDLYIRDYTSKFSESVGTTVLSSSPVIYQGIFDTNQCAKLCVDYTGFSCKSFDFCPDIGTCFLGQKHIFDIPKSQIQTDTLCNHWSRNYIDDFSYTKRKVIPLKDDRIISGVSVQQCAKLCVSEESFSCASFDYCGNQTECRLSTASMKNIGQVTLQPSAYCDIYTRQSFPDGTSYIANPQKYYQTPATNSSGYSTGAMAGLGFGMIILGIILAIVIINVYLKLTNKSIDDMQIKFSRHTDED